MLTRIFCDMDDFCQSFEPELNKFLLESDCKHRIRACRLSLSEIMTIVVQFHRSGYRCFKDFYLKSIRRHYLHLFPTLVSYNRFVELMPKALLALCAFMKSRYGKPTGISYIDSTGLAVCTNKRIRRHRTFRDDAGRGKSSTGWFYGFKLHLYWMRCAVFFLANSLAIKAISPKKRLHCYWINTGLNSSLPIRKT